MKTTRPRSAIFQPLIIIAAACLFFGPALFAAVTLPFYDEFPSTYANGNLGAAGVGDSTWTNGLATTPISVGSASALSYVGLQAPGAGSKGVRVLYPNPAAQSDIGGTFASVSSGSVYVSFLIKLTTSPSGSRTIVNLHNSATPPNTTAKLAIIIDSNGRLSVNKALNAAPLTATGGITNTAALGTTSTHLVVARYTFNTGTTTDDSVDLWLDPGSLGSGSAPAPTVGGVVNTASTDPSSLSTYFLHVQGTGTTGEWAIDEFRIGTSWADVTPVPAVVPGGAYFSSIASGNWNATNTWEYSPDGSTIVNPATITPSIVYAVTNKTSHNVTITNAAEALSLDVLGTVTVSGVGSLNVSNALRVATGGTLNLTTTAATAGPVTMTGGSINGIGGSLTGTSYSVPVGAANVSVSANLAGAAALTISEPTATLALSGTNTYSGDTTIANGTIQANGAGSLPGASNLKTGSSTANNSTLNLATASASYAMNKLSVGGVISFSGPSSGMATLTFTNGADITGSSGKRLNVFDTNTTVIVNGPRFDLIGPAGTSQRILTITNNGNLTINAPLQDLSPATNSGGLTLSGEGIMILSGTNTYQGTNKINTGTLRVNGPAALSAATTLATGSSATNSTKLDLGTPGSYSANGLFLTGILRVSASGGTSSLTLTGACVMAGSGSRALDADTNTTIIVNQPFDLFGGTASTTRNLNAQGSGNFIFNGSLTNGSAPGSYVCGFRKSGAGTATLNAVNSYNGSTTILEGRVALGASASIANSSNIVVYAGAIFDVSAVPGGFTLSAPQILGNSTDSTNVFGPGILKGSINASSNILNLAISNNLPCLNVTNGTLTLSATTAITITQIGSTLPNGSYLLISKSTGGAVSGSVPASVTVGGGGAASAATLAISGGELFLNVGSVTPPSPIPLSVSQAGNVLTFSWTNAAFRLQSQTNALSVGLNTNWTDYPGGSSSPANVTNNPANPAVFFRLLAP